MLKVDLKVARKYAEQGEVGRLSRLVDLAVSKLGKQSKQTPTDLITPVLREILRVADDKLVKNNLLEVFLFDQALPLIEFGERISKKLKCMGTLSYSLMLLGLYYRRKEDEANSLFVTKKALQVVVESGDEEYLAGILLNLSAIQLQMGYTEEGT